MGVGDAGEDHRAVIRVVFHEREIGLVAEHGEAGGDDVGKIHLRRHDGADGPENPDDDLRQVVHGREYDPRFGRG